MNLDKKNMAFPEFFGFLVAKPEGGRDFFCQAILSISKWLIPKHHTRPHVEDAIEFQPQTINEPSIFVIHVAFSLALQ